MACTIKHLQNYKCAYSIKLMFLEMRKDNQPFRRRGNFMFLGWTWIRLSFLFLGPTPVHEKFPFKHLVNVIVA